MAGSESESESAFGPLTLAAPSPQAPGLHVRTLAADPEIPEARGPDSGGAGGTLRAELRLDRGPLSTGRHWHDLGWIMMLP
jgi:hypothetical protein